MYIIEVQPTPSTPTKPLYVKFTCRFGAFHGHIRLTDKKDEARRWTRRKDAARAAQIAMYRAEKYPEDAAKFAGNVFSVAEL